MSEKTNIEWCDSTWNPLRGCSRVSEGCRNCYAEKLAYRFSGAGQPYEGLAVLKNGHASWTGDVRLVEEHLLDPLKWKKPQRIFVNSMSDVFHENVPDEWIDRIFAVMALCPQHVFQLLSKRPERMRDYMSNDWGTRVANQLVRWLSDDAITTKQFEQKRYRLTEPLPNVWLGVSVEDQKTADERIPLLLQIPAALRFVSCEPLLGPLELRVRETDPDDPALGWSSDALFPWDMWRSDDGLSSDGPLHPRIDWVICGGESGPGARPMHIDWARGLRDQCVAAEVPFFFKQWGEWRPPMEGETYTTADGLAGKPPAYLVESSGMVNCFHRAGEENPQVMLRVGKKKAGAVLDGREWKQFPEAQQ